MDRIAANKTGWITFKLLRVQRVSNPELEKRFQMAKDKMEREWHAGGGEGKWQREQVGFVAPEPFNLENVCAKGTCNCHYHTLPYITIQYSHCHINAHCSFLLCMASIQV